MHTCTKHCGGPRNRKLKAVTRALRYISLRPCQPVADGKEIKLEIPQGDELPARGFDTGAEVYQAPPSDMSERGKLSVKVDPASQRLQLLEPFKRWDGDDIKDAAVLIKVRD